MFSGRSKGSNSIMNTYSPLYARESLDFQYNMERKSTTCKRLKDLALYSITQNFGIIMDEYFANEQGNSQEKRFKYLKRLYSKMLFEIVSYSEPGPTKESYIRFLVNEYIKTLDLSFCDDFNHDHFFEALNQVGHTINSVNLSGKSWRTERMIEWISLFPNLETIHLDFTRSRNRLLGNICKKCPHVKTISLSNSRWVTDRSLHFLCTLNETDELEKNQTIECLDVIGTQVTENGILFALKYFPSLKFLRNRHVAEALHLLHQDDLFSGNLDNLSKYGLEEICIYSDVLILEVLQICIVLCPNLTSLCVNKITLPLEIELCLNFSCLKEVQFIFESDCKLKFPSQFFDLHKCNLEKLHLQGAKFCIKALSQCRNLKSLNLTHMIFERFDKSLKPSSNIFPHLTDLEINCTDLSDDNVLNYVIFILSSCSILTKLTFHSIFTFPDNAMDSILKCNFITSLLELDVSFSEINPSSTDKVLALAPRLRRLVIEGCSIPDSDYLRMFRRHGDTVEIIWR